MIYLFTSLQDSAEKTIRGLPKLSMTISFYANFPDRENYMSNVLWMKAGTFSGKELQYYQSELRTQSDDDALDAQFKRLYYGIQNTRVISCLLDADFRLARFLREHICLADKINAGIDLWSSLKPPPEIPSLVAGTMAKRSERSLGLFDVTVNPFLFRAIGKLGITFYYQSATYIYFRNPYETSRSFIDE